MSSGLAGLHQPQHDIACLATTDAPGAAWDLELTMQARRSFSEAPV